MDYIYLIIPAVLLLLAIIVAIILHFRKKTVIKKVNSLDESDKNTLLNNLAKSLGYRYDSYQDIFIARHDAAQKNFGYTRFYDLSAPFFNMVFDYETIYFNYSGRTWLIEMWKGQYGINSGCELGVYQADKILNHNDYNFTVFNAVPEKDMPAISLKLNRHCKKGRCKYFKLGRVRQKHWWLTIFKMGSYSRPNELFVNTSITFKNFSMMRSFIDSFVRTLPNTTYKINGFTVYFTFDKSNRKYSLFKRYIRNLSLFFCMIYCKLFNHITTPFLNSGDKLLYLYYYLPFIVRRMFKAKHK